MDKFPDDFKVTLKRSRNSTQKELIKTVRKNFYDNIIKDNKNGLILSQLIFPDKLHREYRIQISEELLIRFHKIKITFNFNSSPSIKKQFYGYPDDEFFREFMANHHDRSINIKTITIEY